MHTRVYTHTETHSPLAESRRLIGLGRVITSLFHLQLTTKLVEQRVQWTYMVENKVQNQFRKVTNKINSNNNSKQQQQQKMLRKENLISRVSIYILFKMSQCSMMKNIYKEKKSWPKHREKKAVNKNCLGESLDVELNI